MAPAEATLTWLSELAARCAARAAALRRDSLGAPQRAGLLFEVGDRPLLTAIDTLAEVLDQPPQLARVPGTPSWLLGIANHRGTLLPLLDLAALLGGAAPAGRGTAATGRVLIPRRTTGAFGIRVGAVIGLRYFRDTDEAPADYPTGDLRTDPAAPRVPGELAGPRAGGLGLGGIVVGFASSGRATLPVVDLAAVERLPAFLAAAREGDAGRAAPPA